MNPASYVVIRYIADPARNEPLNVGVLAWAGERHELAISDEAVARVVRENPRLHPDALRSIGDVVRDSLGLEAMLPAGELRERVSQQRGYPIALTEPRQTAVASESYEALQATVARLIDRIVKPGRRYGGGGEGVFASVERRLLPLIRTGRVQPHHLFQATGTGVPRSVDFYADSGANIAVDTIRLDLKRANEIRLRADAEAFKVTDIASQNEVRMLVVTTFPRSDELAEVSSEARQILTSTAAEIVDDLDEAVRLVEEAASSAGVWGPAGIGDRA